MKKKLLFTLTFFAVCNALAQTAGFTFQSSNGLFCSPATINFTQTCTGNPIAFNWNFGNGQFSTAANPSAVFIAGTYVVKLTAIFADEAKTVQQTITVNPGIIASLSADKNYICKTGTINFTASASSSIASYEWTFGDGGTGTTTTASIPHNYSALGNYTASVKTIAGTGCFAIATYAVAVQNPAITASVTPTGGCVPAAVNFLASANLPAGDNVINYAWDFGDGSPVSNTVTGANNHSYTVVGSYLPRVSITTNGGCANTYNYPAIAYGTPPTGLVANSDKLIYCGNETPLFFANANTANSYKWDFGDGTVVTTASNNITHKYTTLGVKNIVVTPYFNGCAGNAANLQITIVGVIAGFTYANNCTNKNTFSFTNITLGNQSITAWDFGDGSPTVSTTSPVHSFPANGNFVTTLTVTDIVTGCSDTYSATIFTASPSLTNPDISICKNSITQFTVNNNYSNANSTFTWNVIGQQAGPNATNPFSITASVLGNFTSNFVIVNNGAQYCPDTVYLGNPILVRGPNLSFTMPAALCLNDSLKITNTSTPFIATDVINLWYWNYGITPANDTVFQPGPIKYPTPGVYNIKLAAIDINGCKDSLIKSVTVNPLPFLRIIPRTDTLCEGSTQQLIAFHTDNILWSPPATLSCTVCDTTIANPTVSTKYFVTSLNSFGCSIMDSTFITVINNFAATAVATPLYLCLNDSVNINVIPANKVISWTPTTGLSNANIYNPLAFPKTNIIYTAKLVDSAGCFTRTADVTINIKSLPSVNAGPNQVFPYYSAFTISPAYSSNIVSYNWSPSGNLNCTTCPIVNGIADDKQTYVITTTSDSGCIAKDSITIFVNCEDANIHMPTAFTPDGNNINDTYYPLTRGIKIIKKFIIFDRKGTMVFQAFNFLPNNKLLGWDGRYKGANQPMGSFLYILEAICDTNREIGLNGMFTLIR
jgi:gliding motility-associated-like protein